MELKPHQLLSVKEAVKFLTTNPARACYDGSDPGTGKTISTCALVTEMRFKKILIIAPKVMLRTWAAEARKWTKYRNIEVIESQKDIQKIFTAHICIVAYTSCWRENIAKTLIYKDWDALILDEAQKVKNEDSEQGKFILRTLWPRIRYRIALSGTPFTTCVTDCHSLFSRMLINDKTPGSPFGSWLEFAETFANIKFTPFGSQFVGLKDANLLSKLIRKYFFFRNRREEVLPDLPKRVFQKILLSKRYSNAEYEALLAKMIDEGQDVTNMPEIPTHIMSKINLQGMLKVEPISEYVLDLLEQNLPVIVFTLNKEVLAAYMEKFKAYSPVKIDGASNDGQKNDAIKAFQSGCTNIIICNSSAGGIGITLNRARYVVTAQIPFNPSDIEQWISRANRMGATEQTNISYFVVEKSLDEKVSSMLMSKAEDFNKLFNERKL